MVAIGNIFGYLQSMPTPGAPQFVGLLNVSQLDLTLP